MTKRKPQATFNDSPVLARLIEDLHLRREQDGREAVVRPGFMLQPIHTYPTEALGGVSLEAALREKPLASQVLPTIRDGEALEAAFVQAQKGNEQPLLDLLNLQTGRKGRRGRPVTKNHLAIARVAEVMLMDGKTKTEVCDGLVKDGIVGPEGITPTELDRSLAASRATLDAEYAAEVAARIERGPLGSSR